MGPQRAPWPLLGLPRPRRACRCSWMPRAPDTAGSTELRPKGDATLELRLRLTGSFDAYNRGHMQALREAVAIEKAIDNGNTALASASYEL